MLWLLSVFSLILILSMKTELTMVLVNIKYKRNAPFPSFIHNPLFDKRSGSFIQSTF